MISETLVVEQTTPVSAAPAQTWSLQWTPIVVGALAAASISLILLTFAAALGLGVASTAPTWRDASVALWLLSGIYLVFQALISFGCGGYFAGRVRMPSPVPAEDIETRDGLHGVASWALAVVIGVILTAMIAGFAGRTSPTTQPVSASEPSVLSYELDRLLRAPRRQASVEFANEPPGLAAPAVSLWALYAASASALTTAFAMPVRVLSVFSSSASVSLRSLAAPVKPSSSAHVMRVP